MYRLWLLLIAFAVAGLVLLADGLATGTGHLWLEGLAFLAVPLVAGVVAGVMWRKGQFSTSEAGHRLGSHPGDGS